MTTFDYPLWLRVDHWLNVLFVTLVIRSGIEILATHPKLYWNDDSRPGSEWARFTRKVMPKNKLYDTLDEEEDYSPFISLPGHAQLGLGRHWHFFAVIGWILVGLSYYILLFATGQWHRYWPASWSIFPEAWNDIVTYMTFNLPPLLPGEPLDAMQKLAYAGVVFGLAPFQILTGAAQSPAIEARFPWYVRMWGGRQWARSLHFLGLVAFVGFIAIHLSMVFFWGWGHLTAAMIFGSIRNTYWATALSLLIIATIIAIHVAATLWSLRNPRSVQRRLDAVVGLRSVDSVAAVGIAAELSGTETDCAAPRQRQAPLLGRVQGDGGAQLRRLAAAGRRIGRKSGDVGFGGVARVGRSGNAAGHAQLRAGLDEHRCSGAACTSARWSNWCGRYRRRSTSAR